MIILLVIAIWVDQDIILEIDTEKDLELIIQDLEFLYNNPIDINTATFEELARIPYLSISDCLRILDHRSRIGEFKTLDDLLQVPGFDEIRRSQIEPYITLVRKKEYRIDKFSTRMRVESDIPYQTHDEKCYSKTVCNVSPYQIFLVTEKDPRERSLLDHHSTGIILSDNIRKIGLGMYNLDIGSGVMLSPIGSFFNALDFRLMNQERGILPYTSVQENRGFFGAVLSDSIVARFTIFYSNHLRDGRIDTLGYARSFDNTGDHSDSLGQAKKDMIREELIGYDVRYSFANFTCAQRFYQCRYKPAFACTDSFNDFYGDEFYMYGLEAKYRYDNFLIFSEWGWSYKDQIGGLFGCGGFFRFFDLTLAGKYFPDRYYSPFGSEARPDYTGGIAELTSNTHVINVRTALTLDNKMEEDTTKIGFKVNFEKKIGSCLGRFQLRWRYQGQVKDLSGSRLFLRITPWKWLLCDIRLEDRYIYQNGIVDRGIFGSFEIGLRFMGIHFRSRYGRFSTDSYTSRLYVYEIDLPGVINNRMIYNDGSYGFIFVSFKPLQQIRMSLKYRVIKQDASTAKKLGAQIDIGFQ